MIIVICLLVGLLAGGLTAIVGTGAGLLIIPALVLLVHLNTKTAIGTSLTAMLLPVGFFAAYIYWKSGSVNVRDSAYIALGFVIGSLIAALTVKGVSSESLSKVFGATAVIIGLKMLFF